VYLFVTDKYSMAYVASHSNRDHGDLFKQLSRALPDPVRKGHSLSGAFHDYI